MQGAKGIALRITLLAWLISLLTLAVFVTAIIPQQKSDLQEALRSKARGVAVSLEGITASAAVSEDYSTIVDQALLVLAGDEAIDYLVVTRNDGYSVIAERKTWRSGQLDRFWHPEAREPVGAIRIVPLFQRRVYAYSQPFSYSGIEWGWLHVGLSLGAYDRSVLQIYERTGLLAIICVILSLVPSLYYARHLVRPIRSLQTVVEEVAHGNLQARAHIRGGDEVEHLAGAFNSMADTILNRNQILESVGYAAKELLSASDWTLVIEDVLGKISKAGGVTRSYVLQNAFEDGAFLSRERCEWVAAGMHSILPKWQSFKWSSGFLDSYREQLSNGQEVTFPAEKLDGTYAWFHRSGNQVGD